MLKKRGISWGEKNAEVTSECSEGVFLWKALLFLGEKLLKMDYFEEMLLVGGIWEGGTKKCAGRGKRNVLKWVRSARKW